MKVTSLNRLIVFNDKSDDEQYEEYEADISDEELLMREPEYHPWQMKHKLRIENEDEVQFDDDDEDATIL